MSTALGALEALAPGLRKAAVILTGLEQTGAIAVLEKMSRDDALACTKALLRVGMISETEQRAALHELSSKMGRLSDMPAPRTEWIGNVLSESRGQAEAAELLEEAGRPAPFVWMDTADPDALVAVLQSESAATVAVVLAMLDKAAAARLLVKLSEEMQTEVTNRIASLNHIQESTLACIDATLREQVGKALTTPTRTLDGVATTASILGRVKRRDADRLLDGIRAKDERKAVRVKDQMFTFEDLLVLFEGRYLTKVFTSVDTDQLAIAMSGANEDQVATIFSSLPERKRLALQETVDNMPRKRREDVVAARREIVSVAGSLEATGDILRMDADEMTVDDE